MPVNTPLENNFGWKASNFNLKSVDDEYYSLNDLIGNNGTVIVFICNHCPYVISIADRLSYEARELKKLQINFIGIMSNDVKSYPEDSFENMKKFSNQYNFKFPYLYDETQEIAKNYNAVCTPDFFGFDKDLKLKYRGRLDSGVMNSEVKEIQRELFNAMIKIKNEGVGPSEQKNSIGCSIKWK